MSKTLAELLNQHLANHGWSFERLAEEAGLPRNTVYRWTRGEVRKVRHWQDVVSVAQVLALNRSQANALLTTSGHPPVETLRERATQAEDRGLLFRWTLTSVNNLPAQLTTFFGRGEELERLTRLLASARLITLTGTGGSGKTRLAIELAQSVPDEFEGVFFIDLAPVRDPALVLPTIAQALGVRETPDEPPRVALETYLRDKRMLLVLDNFEQVIEAAPLVTGLLAAARWMKAIVTSRTRLHVRGEHEFVVPPLSLPVATSGLDEIRLNPSVSLFADRARAVDPSFTLTPGSAPLVAAVCARLDGLPLAIELAAARTRYLTLSSMLEQLSRLALASGGPRDVSDRQRTLRATIAWSFDLLSPNEQRLFEYVGVFVGGFAEQAAPSICAGVGLLETVVSAGLKSLVERNLLRRYLNIGDEPRYEMLETIREYALERLETSGATETVRWAAAQHYVALAESADLEGEGQRFWLQRLITEHDNFRMVLDWCRERGQIETGLRLCIGLMPMWQLRDHQLEARTWLRMFTSVEGTVPPNLRARGLLWQGLLLMRGSGDHAAASRHVEEGLSLFRAEGDLNGASEALQALGDVDRNQGALKLASQRYTESLALAKQTDNAYLIAHGYMGLALCAQEEEPFEAARHDWERTLEWAERAGNDASAALALNSLGEMARHAGDWEEARLNYERTLTLARELGNDFRMALALHNLGYVALQSEEPERARKLFTESLSLYVGGQYHKGTAECLAGLGRVEASQGRPERAARLCGATETILRSLGTRLDTLDRADYERTLGTLRSQLGERVHVFLDEGRTMLRQDAVEYAFPDHCDVPTESAFPA